MIRTRRHMHRATIHPHAIMTVWLSVLAVLTLGVACSSSDADDTEPDAGAPTAGNGGEAGNGDEAGSGGTHAEPDAGDADDADAGWDGDCAPPSTAGHTALCLQVVPQQVDATTDPALDGQGVLMIQIFDTANPPDDDDNEIALYEGIFPENIESGAEVSLDDLPDIREELDLPDTIYVRAVFVDNPAVFANEEFNITWGLWLGGMDLSTGLGDDIPLQAIPINVGAGNEVAVDLQPMRRLDITVTASAEPIGNAQGALDAIVVGDADLSAGPGIFGFASLECADLSDNSSAEISTFLVGDGPYWVTAALNDLGLEGDLAPGTMAALTQNETSGAMEATHQLDFDPSDYVISIDVDLNFVVPFEDDGDAGVPDPDECE